MTTPARHAFGLAAYSLPWRCGFAGAGTPRACSTPLDANGLLDMAIQLGLSSLEFPLMMLPDLEPATLATFRARAQAHHIALIIDSGVVDIGALEREIPAAAALGARVVRVVLSGILEGARTTIPGGWEAHLAEMITRLRAIRPLAEQYGVCIAPENHQDATSADLLRVCEEVGGEYIGVTLDAVNPLAVGEDPIEFAAKLGSRIVNVHLKDYHIHLTESGYRLVRCPLGAGVLDVPALFTLLDRHAPQAYRQIELAALHARHIRLLEADWWQGFPPTDARALLPALRLAVRHARPAGEDWRTPWERGDDMTVYEETEIAHSVEYLATLCT